jgi:hypothetical protein
MKKKVFSKWCLALPSLRPPHCLSFFVSDALLCKNISSSSSSPIKKKRGKGESSRYVGKDREKKRKDQIFSLPKPAPSGTDGKKV